MENAISALNQACTAVWYELEHAADGFIYGSSVLETLSNAGYQGIDNHQLIRDMLVSRFKKLEICRNKADNFSIPMRALLGVACKI